MKSATAIKIMRASQATYDEIADDFSQTRSFLWEFKALAPYAQAGDRILDLGCGNGRLADLFADKNVVYVGVDNSAKLLVQAQRLQPAKKFILINGLELPFADNEFDKIFCLAVFHHVPGIELRIKFLREARRVLKPDGRMILTTWYLWPVYQHAGLFIKYTWQKLIGQSELDWVDIYKPWGQHQQSQRYFHHFSPRALKKVLQKAGFKIEKIDQLTSPGGSQSLLAVVKK